MGIEVGTLNNSPLQRLNDPLWDQTNIQLWIKRDDLIHPVVSGNKIRKLAFLLSEFESGTCKGILSFGGSYSNHIHALAWLCNAYSVPFTAMIRNPAGNLQSPTIEDVLRWDGEIIPVSAEEYLKKKSPEHLLHLRKDFPGYLIIPEGGSHSRSLEGISTMVNEIHAELPEADMMICPVGTGATFAGMVRSKKPAQWVIGISALKSSVVKEEMKQQWQLEHFGRWTIADQWHFGGYGRAPDKLLEFIEVFRQSHGILLDPLYNGKAMYAFYQYVAFGLIPSGSKIVFIHTGGLQGWKGFYGENPTMTRGGLCK